MSIYLQRQSLTIHYFDELLNFVSSFVRFSCRFQRKHDQLYFMQICELKIVTYIYF